MILTPDFAGLGHDSEIIAFCFQRTGHCENMLLKTAATIKNGLCPPKWRDYAHYHFSEIIPMSYISAERISLLMGKCGRITHKSLFFRCLCGKTEDRGRSGKLAVPHDEPEKKCHFSGCQNFQTPDFTENLSPSSLFPGKVGRLPAIPPG